MLLSGHPEVSWSVVLDAVVAEAPGADAVRDRLQSELTLPVSVEEVAAEEFEDRLEAQANSPYAGQVPLLRVLLGGGPERHVAVAGHHAAVDGLGLVALLGLVLGSPVSSSVRGLGPGRGARRLGARYAAGRLLEGVFVPPTRIAPEHRRRTPGDHLVRRKVAPTAVDTAELIAAAARAVRAWNERRGRPVRRVVVAVGASRRSGERPDLAERSAYFRLRIGDPRPDTIRRALQAASPEPAPTGPAGIVSIGARLARPMARRLGSTLLVSNLGQLSTPAPVRSAAFFPAAHGRSGVSLGSATVGGATVLTLRARRAGFSRAGAIELLDLLVGFLPAAP